MSNRVITRPRLELMKLLPPQLTGIDTRLLVLSRSRPGNASPDFSVGPDQRMVQEARLANFLLGQPLDEMNSFVVFLSSVN